MRNTLIWLLLLAGSALLPSCDRNNNVNLIDSQEDVVMGKQLAEELLSQPDQYPVLDPQDFPQAYTYLEQIVNNILESGEVAYREEFAWQVFIIKDDDMLNAFATPGGYIYVYSGLIKYLDSEQALAGVLGHEIAHADLRHSSRQLQKAYGLNLVFSLLLGEGEDRHLASEIAAKLAGQLAGLRFSREYEEEADKRSVEYLAHTPYPCNAAGRFFIKLEEEEEQTDGPPTFLSTHPHPENRIAKIEGYSRELGCLQETAPPGADTRYQAFQQSLP